MKTLQTIILQQITLENLYNLQKISLDLVIIIFLTVVINHFKVQIMFMKHNKLIKIVKTNPTNKKMQIKILSKK